MDNNESVFFIIFVGCFVFILFLWLVLGIDFGLGQVVEPIGPEPLWVDNMVVYCEDGVICYPRGCVQNHTLAMKYCEVE